MGSFSTSFEQVHPGWQSRVWRSDLPASLSCAGLAAKPGCGCVGCGSWRVPADSAPCQCGTAAGTDTGFCCSSFQSPLVPDAYQQRPLEMDIGKFCECMTGWNLSPSTWWQLMNICPYWKQTGETRKIKIHKVLACADFYELGELHFLFIYLQRPKRATHKKSRQHKRKCENEL